MEIWQIDTYKKVILKFGVLSKKYCGYGELWHFIKLKVNEYACIYLFFFLFSEKPKQNAQQNA